ncbi:MAG: bifunctional metallophosphatase/5'-nucleotidase [Deltaproteobacteria bacterium]|nr:bifunctional metallophosphatase/5'-nucleotidase [Deltaproteobacteria bacterium]
MRRHFFLRKMVPVMVALLLVAIGFPRMDVATGGPAARERLVILFTHDLHSYFLPQRVAVPDGPPVERGGYAKLLSLIRENREGDRTLLVDAGDFSMGTLFHTTFMTEAAELRLMAAMGYDVMTLGNHDFDFHTDGLAKALRKARAAEKKLPVMVASNVVFSPDGKGDGNLKEAFREYPVVPYAVIERRGVRIGLFGILGKDAQIDTPFAKPVTFSDPVETSKQMVDLLKNKEKTDLIVCLSHTGTAKVKKHSEDEALARAVPEIDVIISGHTHTTLSNPIVIGKTLIVSAGSYGAYLGRLAVDYEKGAGVTLAGYELKPVTSKIPDDPDLARQIARYEKDVDKEYLAAYNSRLDQVVAESAFDMETLDYAHAHPGETGIGDLITDAFRYAVEKAEGARYEHIDIALQPLGNIRDSFLKGPITVADLFRTLSLGLGTDGSPGYPLVAYYTTGKELKDLLEVETTIGNLKNDAHLQFSGVNFSFNPHRVPFDRVTSIQVRNAKGVYEPVVPEKLYRICMNYYTAQMVNYVRNASYGLLSVTPRDREGRPVADTRQGIIDADALVPGVQEIKEWVALAAYMKSFPDTDGNGIPDIPAKYRQPEGRFSPSPSWNPIRLIAGGNGITYGAIGILILLHIVGIVLIGFVVRLIRRRIKTAKGH